MSLKYSKIAVIMIKIIMIKTDRCIIREIQIYLRSKFPKDFKNTNDDVEQVN